MNFLRSSLRSPLRSPLGGLQIRNFASCRYNNAFLFTSPFLTSFFTSFLSSSFVGLFFTGAIRSSIREGLYETNKLNLEIIDQLKRMEEMKKK
jgi:hypothetical protein